jgi:hypothetical protein
MAIERTCGHLADFVELAWDGLNMLPRLSPRSPASEFVLFRGAPLSQEALDDYAQMMGRFVCWSSFASVTTRREIAARVAHGENGEVPVVFEIRSAGRPLYQGGVGDA